MDVVGSVALLPPILFPTVLVLRARAIISLHGNLVGTFGQPFQILVNHDFATFGIPQFSGCMAGLEVTGIGTAFRPSGQGIVEVRVYKQARHLTRAAFLAQRLDHGRTERTFRINVDAIDFGRVECLALLSCVKVVQEFFIINQTYLLIRLRICIVQLFDFNPQFLICSDIHGQGIHTELHGRNKPLQLFITHAFVSRSFFGHPDGLFVLLLAHIAEGFIGIYIFFIFFFGRLDVVFQQGTISHRTGLAQILQCEIVHRSPIGICILHHHTDCGCTAYHGKLYRIRSKIPIGLVRIFHRLHIGFCTCFAHQSLGIKETTFRSFVHIIRHDIRAQPILAVRQILQILKDGPIGLVSGT